MRMRRINLHAFLLATGILLAVMPRMFAQHEVTADDVREGERLFAATCTGCHGAEGDGVFGVDLGRGQFRNSSTDEDLIRTIKNGLPRTSWRTSARECRRQSRWFRETPIVGRRSLKAKASV